MFIHANKIDMTINKEYGLNMYVLVVGEKLTLVKH